MLENLREAGRGEVRYGEGKVCGHKLFFASKQYAVVGKGFPKIPIRNIFLGGLNGMRNPHRVYETNFHKISPGMLDVARSVMNSRYILRCIIESEEVTENP